MDSITTTVDEISSALQPLDGFLSSLGPAHDHGNRLMDVVDDLKESLSDFKDLLAKSPRVSDTMNVNSQRAFSSCNVVAKEVAVVILNSESDSGYFRFIWKEPEVYVQNLMEGVANQVKVFNKLKRIFKRCGNNEAAEKKMIEENLKTLETACREANEIAARRSTWLDSTRQEAAGGSGQCRRTTEDALSSPGYAEHYRQSVHQSFSRGNGSPTVPENSQFDTRSLSPRSSKSSAQLSAHFQAASRRPGLTGRVFSRLGFTDDATLNRNLCEACQDGNLKGARQTVAEGADVNGRHDGRTPLYYAVLAGSREIVDFLVLEMQARIDGNGKDSFIVWVAVSKNHVDILKVLLRQTVWVDSVVPCSPTVKLTPLGMAIERHHVEAAQLLIEHGANLNLAGRGFPTLTPLCAAANKRRLDLVELLLKAPGANGRSKGVDIEDKQSKTTWGSELTAVHVAAYHGFHEALVALLDKCPHLLWDDCTVEFEREKYACIKPIHISKGKECMELLLEQDATGSMENSRDSNGARPIHWAARRGDPEAIKVLLPRVGSKMTDKSGAKALQIAVETFAKKVARLTIDESELKGYQAVVQELLKAGAEVGDERQKMIKACESIKTGGKAKDEAPTKLLEDMKLLALMRYAAKLAKTRADNTKGPTGVFAESLLTIASLKNSYKREKKAEKKVVEEDEEDETVASNL